MLSVDFFLVIAAFITTIASAIGKSPVWVPVLLLSLVEMFKLFGR